MADDKDPPILASTDAKATPARGEAASGKSDEAGKASKAPPIADSGKPVDGKKDEAQEAARAQKVAELEGKIVGIQDEVARIMDKLNTGPKSRQEIDALKVSMDGCKSRFNGIVHSIQYLNPGHASFSGIEESLQAGMGRIASYQAVAEVNAPIMGMVSVAPEAKDDMLGFLAELSPAQKLDAESNAKIEETKKKLHRNNESHDKHDELEKNIVFLDEPEAKKLAIDDPAAFREQQIQLKALICSRGALLEDDRAHLDEQEQEILKKAQRNGIVAETIPELNEKIALLPPEEKLREPIAGLQDLATSWQKDADKIAEREANLEKMKEQDKRLEMVRERTLEEFPEKTALRPIDASEVIAKLQNQVNETGLDATQLRHAENKAVIAEQAEQAARQELQAKTVELQAKTVELQAQAVDLSAADNEIRSMTVNIGKTWGVKPEEMAGKSTQDIVLVLEEQLRINPSLLTKHPDTAELFTFVKEDLCNTGVGVNSSAAVSRETDSPASSAKSFSDVSMTDSIMKGSSERMTEASPTLSSVVQVKPAVSKGIDTSCPPPSKDSPIPPPLPGKSGGMGRG